MPRHMVAACALGLLVLSGCGGEPEKPEPTQATASPTRTTPAAPELPEAAREDTQAGATAFVRHYLALMNHALLSGDTSAVKSVSAEDCGSCQNARDRVDEIYNSGGNVRGGTWELVRVVSIGRNRRVEGWGVSVIVRFGAQTVIEGDPPRTDRNKAGKLLINFLVSRGSEGWVMSDWNREQ